MKIEKLDGDAESSWSALTILKASRKDDEELQILGKHRIGDSVESDPGDVTNNYNQ